MDIASPPAASLFQWARLGGGIRGEIGGRDGNVLVLECGAGLCPRGMVLLLGNRLFGWGRMVVGCDGGGIRIEDPRGPRLGGGGGGDRRLGLGLRGHGHGCTGPGTAVRREGNRGGGPLSEELAAGSVQLRASESRVLYMARMYGKETSESRGFL